MEIDTTEHTRTHPQRINMPPISRGPPHTLIGRARHAPRRARPSRRDGGAGNSQCTSRSSPLRTPAPIGLFTQCGADVLLTPSCKEFFPLFLSLAQQGSGTEDRENDKLSFGSISGASTTTSRFRGSRGKDHIPLTPEIPHIVECLESNKGKKHGCRYTI